jgi:hypothetical protein
MNRVIGFVVFLAIAGGLAYFRSGSRAETEALIAATPERVAEVCGRSAGFEKHREFIETHADKAHEYAFNIAYEPGARRRPAKFDSRKYATAFGENLVRQGKADRKPNADRDAFLRQLQIDLETAAAAGEFDSKE